MYIHFYNQITKKIAYLGNYIHIKNKAITLILVCLNDFPAAAMWSGRCELLSSWSGSGGKVNFEN